MEVQGTCSYKLSKEGSSLYRSPLKSECGRPTIRGGDRCKDHLRSFGGLPEVPPAVAPRVERPKATKAAAPVRPVARQAATVQASATCTHEFQRGALKGTLCSEPTIMDGRCQEHLELEEPIPTLGLHGTCSHRFVAGVRSGKYCPQYALTPDGPCEVHQRITDDARAGVTHCAHKFTYGQRRNCYCTSPVDIEGKCWSHHMATAALDAPRGGTDADDYAPKPTCNYQFTRGDREGKYCPHNAGEAGFCYKHRNIANRPPRAKKEKKARVPKTPCIFTMRGGKRAGQPCGKRADVETQLCKSHSRYKGQCLHVEKIVITRYSACCRRIAKGVRCERHLDTAVTSPTKVETESDSE